MTAPRIVLLGATGYTGRLIAARLPACGVPFVLAARDPARLDRLAAATPGALQHTADATDPASLRRLIRRGDAVIDCAGPFSILGEPVVRACIESGAHYLDTTGEQPWMRSVHQRYDADARAAGVAVVNAMAFEYALGDCAAAVLLPSLPAPARSLDVIYAWGGTASSRGTRRTALRMAGTRGWEREQHEFRRRALGSRRRRFTFGSGRVLHAVTFGAGEVVTVPRWMDVPTVRGWLVMGPTLARLVSLAAPLLPLLAPALRPILQPLVLRAPDPGPDDRARSRFTIRLEARDRDGALHTAEVRGTDPYGITAVIAVTGALRMLRAAPPGGVLAPSRLVPAAALFDALRPHGIELVR